MSRPDLKESYAKWLASDEGQAIEVNTLEITQDGNFTHYICDYGQTFTADNTYRPVGMTFGTETRKNTTEQRLTVTLDALEGQVFNELKAITETERFDPIRVIYRMYLDNDTSGPAIDPPSEFILTGAACDMGRINLELSTISAPQRRCGQYATVDKFPALRYL